jgi:hypothetical protein
VGDGATDGEAETVGVAEPAGAGVDEADGTGVADGARVAVGGRVADWAGDGVSLRAGVAAPLVAEPQPPSASRARQNASHCPRRVTAAMIDQSDLFMWPVSFRLSLLRVVVPPGAAAAGAGGPSDGAPLNPT